MLSSLLESMRVLRTPCVKCRFEIIRNFSESPRKVLPELAMFSSDQEKVFCIFYSPMQGLERVSCKMR